MPLVARDPSGRWVSAEEGIRQQIYFCPECRSPVRLKRGFARKAHFFHLQKKKHCRHRGKSRTHLLIQERIQRDLPKGECVCEKPFPSINRIADVVWEQNKIVFEVQCSFMSVEEMEERTQDYKEAGYEVVWILHDKTFSKPYLERFERILSYTPHYFTDINSLGIGKIYDQIRQVASGKCYFLSKPFPILLHRPERLEAPQPTSLPPLLEQRYLKWPLFFSQDLLWHSLYKPDPFPSLLLLKKRRFRFTHFKKIARKYRSFIAFLLKRCCKG